MAGWGVGSSGWFASSAGFIDHRRGTIPKAHEHLRVKRPVVASNPPCFDRWRCREQKDQKLARRVAGTRPNTDKTNGNAVGAVISRRLPELRRRWSEAPWTKPDDRGQLEASGEPVHARRRSAPRYIFAMPKADYSPHKASPETPHHVAWYGFAACFP